MNETKIKWFAIGFCSAVMLFLIIFTFKAVAQDGDTTMYLRLNKDTVVIATFDKHCVDSIVKDYKNLNGYCPYKKIQYINVSK